MARHFIPLPMNGIDASIAFGVAGIALGSGKHVHSAHLHYSEFDLDQGAALVITDVESFLTYHAYHRESLHHAHAIQQRVITAHDAICDTARGTI